MTDQLLDMIRNMNYFLKIIMIFFKKKLKN